MHITTISVARRRGRQLHQATLKSFADETGGASPACTAHIVLPAVSMIRASRYAQSVELAAVATSQQLHRS
jgi:hypothetical protein